jgi:hypothetical protein
VGRDGALLAELRWRELRALTADRALQAADYLIDAALRVPRAGPRRITSGLVVQQALFHRKGGLVRLAQPVPGDVNGNRLARDARLERQRPGRRGVVRGSRCGAVSPSDTRS